MTDKLSNPQDTAAVPSKAMSMILSELGKKQSVRLFNWFNHQLGLSLETMISDQEVRDKIHGHLTKDMVNSFNAVMAEASTMGESWQVDDTLGSDKHLQDALHELALLKEQLKIEEATRNDYEKLISDTVKHNKEIEEEIKTLKASSSTADKQNHSAASKVQKQNLVGRILIHTLKETYEKWQATPDGEKFRDTVFFKAFPREFYQPFIDEIRIIVGENDLQKIENQLSNYIHEKKGSRVFNLPDDDPIYQSKFIVHKRDRLLGTLFKHMERESHFKVYLENKLEKYGVRSSHIKLLQQIIFYGYEKIGAEE